MTSLSIITTNTGGEVSGGLSPTSSSSSSSSSGSSTNKSRNEEIFQHLVDAHLAKVTTRPISPSSLSSNSAASAITFRASPSSTAAPMSPTKTSAIQAALHPVDQPSQQGGGGGFTPLNDLYSLSPSGAFLIEHATGAVWPAAASNLTKPPEFTTRLPRDITVAASKPIKLTATIAGNPLPDITWYRDDEDITENANEEKHTFELDAVSGLVILTVEQPDPNSDAAIYRCILENSFGACSSTCNVKIQQAVPPTSTNANSDNNYAKQQANQQQVGGSVQQQQQPNATLTKGRNAAAVMAGTFNDNITNGGIDIDRSLNRNLTTISEYSSSQEGDQQLSTSPPSSMTSTTTIYNMNDDYNNLTSLAMTEPALRDSTEEIELEDDENGTTTTTTTTITAISPILGAVRTIIAGGNCGLEASEGDDDADNRVSRQFCISPRSSIVSATSAEEKQKEQVNSPQADTLTPLTSSAVECNANVESHSIAMHDDYPGLCRMTTILPPIAIQEPVTAAVSEEVAVLLRPDNATAASASPPPAVASRPITLSDISVEILPTRIPSQRSITNHNDLTKSAHHEKILNSLTNSSSITSTSMILPSVILLQLTFLTLLAVGWHELQVWWNTNEEDNFDLHELYSTLSTAVTMPIVFIIVLSVASLTTFVTTSLAPGLFQSPNNNDLSNSQSLPLQKKRCSLDSATSNTNKRHL